MYGKANWFGKEVEGRLTGVMTCFIRHMLPEPEDCPKGVMHFYFTIEYTVACLKRGWKAVQAMLDKDFLVTVEANEAVLKLMPPDVRVRAHIIYRIQTPSLHLLKDTDSVALDVAPYDVNITTLHHFQKVKPRDYTYDTKGKD